MRRKAHHTTALLALLMAMPLPGSNSVQAQEVRGHLLEEGTGSPILLGSIALLDTAFVEQARTLSNDRGAFILEAPGPGSYFVRADALGYEPRMDGILELGEGGSITIEFFLLPAPIELDSIHAVVSLRQTAFLERQGFFDRKNQGFGHFISPEEVEALQAITAAEVVRRAPFVRTNWTLDGDEFVFFPGRGGRSGSRGCVPKVMVDGVRAWWVPGRAGVLDDWVSGEDIIAVEVYRGVAEIPQEFGAFETCGVILIWTDWGVYRSRGR